MTDLLAISRPSFTRVNRAVYRELARRGWSVELLVPDRLRFAASTRGPDARAPEDPPLHLLPLTSDQQRLHTYRGLPALLRRTRPRVILLDNDPASRLAVELGRWARAHRAALVCQSCENQSRSLRAAHGRAGARGVAAALAIRLLARLARPNVDHVLAISADGVAALRELGFAGRISKIPLGFDPRLFCPDSAARERVRRALRLEAPTVAYFGMLTRAKGVHLLIAALRSLRDLEWQLLVDEFGLYGGPYQDTVREQLRSSGMAERVVFFDAGHEQVPEYMNAADLVVLPSITTRESKEQYGRVVAEAMACGRMVIVSDSGALPELVSGAGVCVPQNDVAALERALRTALSDPAARERYGGLARARAHAELSVVTQAQILSDVFATLTGPRAAGV